MAVPMRNTWTDERLDDGFRHVTTELRELRREMKSEFASVRSELATEIGSVRTELASEIGSVRTEIGSVRSDLGSEIGSLRSEMNARFAQVDRRFDELQRTLMLTGGAIVAALLGVIATQL